MFIIVESGSTKADWVVVRSKDDTQFFKTQGINPATQTELLDLTKDVALLQVVREAGYIYFYGAGIIDTVSTARIGDWLIAAGFKGKISVSEDMIAAARACCGDDPGIVCILGTGSNSCVYDGTKITRSIPTLGYIFSDEGGGTNIGKEILKSYFYGIMPEHEKAIFKANFSVTKELLVEKVYRTSEGNKYVASFAQFLVLIDGPWKDNLLKKVFRDFITLRILLYPEHKTHKIKFVGSIAHYHHRYLSEVLEEFDLKADEIIQQPIYKLIDYHLKHNIHE
jgi:N-acetylglucosamine kinase-like BadF-type ATPase